MSKSGVSSRQIPICKIRNRMDKTKKQSKILAVICARSGSKSIPKKNITKLLGKPLIYYTIKFALECKDILNKTIISTDDEEIASIAESYGIDVPFIRPKELATDTAGKVEVLRHALKSCEKIYQKQYNIIIDLDVTSPIRTKDDLVGCIATFKLENRDVLFTVVNSRKNPYFNMIEVNKGVVQLCKKTKEPILRRQDAPPVYDMNTSIYVYSRDFLMNPRKNSVFSAKNIGVYLMKDISAIDIDSQLDFKYIEFLAKSKQVKL